MSPKQLVFVICTWSLATPVAGKVRILVSFDAQKTRLTRLPGMLGDCFGCIIRGHLLHRIKV
jgi:hypothetical protein